MCRHFDRFFLGVKNFQSSSMGPNDGQYMNAVIITPCTSTYGLNACEWIAVMIFLVKMKSVSNSCIIFRLQST